MSLSLRPRPESEMDSTTTSSACRMSAREECDWSCLNIAHQPRHALHIYSTAEVGTYAHHAADTGCTSHSIALAR